MAIVSVLALAVQSGAPALASSFKALTQDDIQLFQTGEEAAREAGQHFENPSDRNPFLEQGQRQAQDLVKKLTATNPTMQRMEALNKRAATYQNYNTIIFASLSLEGVGLEDLLAMASENTDSVVVFRGLPDGGTNISEGIRRLQELGREFDPPPNVILDPTMFDEYDVSVVPTIVQLKEPGERVAGRTELARVAGLTTPAWLKERVRRGAEGDLGQQGPIEEIEEQDLIELMHQRVTEVDWDTQKQQAISNFWHGQDFIWMPSATQSRTRYIDPRVLATEDILDSEGGVVVEEGTIVNPFDHMGFTQALIVFDATDEAQIKQIEEILPEIWEEDNVHRISLIATEIDRDLGWDGYQALSDRLDQHIYILTPSVRERFDLQYTPSVVTSDGSYFIVRELARARDLSTSRESDEGESTP